MTTSFQLVVASYQQPRRLFTSSLCKLVQEIGQKAEERDLGGLELFFVVVSGCI